MKSTIREKSANKKRSAKGTIKHKRKTVKLKVSKTHKPEDLGLEEWQRILRKQNYTHTRKKALCLRLKREGI